MHDYDNTDSKQSGSYTDTGRSGALSGDAGESESNELEAASNRDVMPQGSGFEESYSDQGRDDTHASGQSIDFSGTQVDSDFEPD